MIPVRLKIQGLYSYQGPQEIDFGPLLDAGLFGIFGGVGSGKSTILEAMTFALYGQTDRLNQRGDDRLYNMMNLQSSDFLVDFECIAGPQNQRYRFVVRAQRNKKRYEDVPKAERNVYCWLENEWRPLQEQPLGESIIGLSYDNFRRTIIIPQGRFQDFIELKGQDRTEMMKEIFQLEKFDLAGPTAKLQKENNQKILVLTGQLVGMEEIQPELLASLHQEEKLLKDHLETLSTEYQQLQLVQETLNQVANWKAMEVQLQNRKKQLDDQANDMHKLKSKILTFEHVQSHYQADVIRWQNSQRQRQHFTSQWNESIGQLNQIESQYKSIQDQQEAWKERLKQLEKQREELILWQTEEKLWVLQDQWNVFKRRREELEHQLEVFKKQEHTIQAQRHQVMQQVEELSRQLHPNFFDISTRVRQWHQTKQVHLGQKEELKKEAERIKFQVDQASLRVQEAREKWLAFGSEVEALYVQERQKLEDALTQWHVHQSWSHLVTHLHEGSPCPVCGALDHPNPAQLVGTQPKSPEELLKKREALEERYQLYKKAEKEVEIAQSALTPLESQKAEVIQKWENNKVLGTNLLQSFPFPESTWQDETVFLQWEQEQKSWRAQLDACQLQIRALDTDLQNRQLEKTVREQHLLEAQRQEHGQSVLWNAQRQVLTREPLANSLLEAQQMQVKTQAMILQEEQAYQTFEHTLKDTWERLQAASQRANQWKELVDRECQVENELASTLETRTQQDSLLGSIENLLSWLQIFTPETLAMARSQRDTYQQETMKWEEAYQLWMEQGKAFAGLTYDPSQHLLAQQALADLQLKLDETKNKLGGVQHRRTDVERLLSEKAHLIEQKTSLEHRKSELDTLERLFRGQSFVNFVSRIFLEQLCAVANLRFERMTRGQLQLKIGPENTFWVIDRLNGGRERLLKTLSGGQKFQASLALALALADGIQQRLKLEQHFFFIDEGFGSLDKDSLQVVFETLTSLRQEKRRVGVISHVEDLQQEIQTYLQIKRLDTGSQIIKSWET